MILDVDAADCHELDSPTISDGFDTAVSCQSWDELAELKEQHGYEMI